MNLNYIRDFNKIGSGDINIAGGKGANLGEMTRAGFPIPSGFVITTNAFDLFMENFKNRKENFNALSELTSENIKDVSRFATLLREKLEKTPIPERLIKDINEKILSINEKNYYAIRSSATAEDLPGASFAGQQDTYLNITGVESILEHIRKCWVSLFTDRAILYRIEKGFSHTDVKLSVVVQKMISPETSGIMFTADPLSGHRKIISIDAGFGLGEALVSGLITPDLYKVDKRDYSINSIDVNEKDLQILSVPGGGTVTEKLVKEKRTSQVLSREQIIELAKIGRKIEKHYGSPQDIEWCFEKDELYIVQSRPITSLFPVPETSSAKEDLKIYISIGHIQVMSEAMPPMAHSMIKLFLPFGKKGYEGEYNPYVVSAGGRIYANISPLLNNKKLRKILPERLAVMDPRISGALVEIVQNKDFLQSAKSSKDKVKFGAAGKLIIPLLLKALIINLLKNAKGRTDERFAYFDKHIQNISNGMNNAENGLMRLLRARSAVETMVDYFLSIFPYFLPAFIAVRKISKMVFGKNMDEQILALQRGLKGNVTTEMDLEIGDLADIIRKSQGLFDLLSESTDLKKTINDLELNKQHIRFTTEWNKFITLYGFRGVSEFDISRPRWDDDPSSIFQVILGSLKEDVTGAHRIHYNNLTEKAEKATIELCEAVNTGLFGKAKKNKMKRLIRFYRDSLPLREHGKYFLMKLFGLVRKEIIKEAGLLFKNNRISDIDDVWFLEFNELIEAVSSNQKDLKSRITYRKNEFETYKSMKPPRVMTSDGEIPTPKIKGDFPPKALPGAGVSAGIIEGIARVLMDPHSEILHKGEILVAPFTDPAWTPLFINAAAVVIEVGGLMTHGSVIAREYGIPAVVSIENATELIKSGQKIRVNGDAGYVEIIEE